MDLIYGDVFLFQLGSIISLLFMIVFTIKKARRSPLSNTLIVLYLLPLLWITTQIIDINARTYDVMWAAIRIKFIALCLIGFFWLIFSLQYAGYKLKKHKFFIGLLLFPGVFSYIMLLTNPYHHLIFRIFDLSGKYIGILGYFLLITTYIYLFWGIIIIIKATYTNRNISKKATFLLLCSAVLPFVPNFLFIAGIIDPGFDISPISFSYCTFLHFIAMYRYKFLDILPIALERVFDNVGESIIYIDNQHNIKDYNQTFNDIILSSQLLNTDIKKPEVVDLYGDFFKDLTSKAANAGNCEINIPYVNQKIFKATIKSIFDKKGNSLGKIIFLKDITVYKKLINELHEKKQQLELLNHQQFETNLKLKSYLNSVEELAIARERDRVSTELHDSLGHAMIQIISLIKIAQISLIKNTDESKNCIEQAIDISIESNLELEKTLLGVISNKYENGICTSLKKLTDGFRHIELNISMHIEGEEHINNHSVYNTIFHICQEGITNAVKHGSAQNLEIHIKADTEKVNIYICDDGIGCNKFIPGFGLSGLAKRVNSLNGVIDFKPGMEKGFVIEASIFLGGNNAV